MAGARTAEPTTIEATMPGVTAPPKPTTSPTTNSRMARPKRP